MSDAVTFGDSRREKEDEGERLLTQCHESALLLKEKFATDSYRSDRDIFGALRRLRDAFVKCWSAEFATEKYVIPIAHDMIKTGVSEILCKILTQSLPSKWLDDDGGVDGEVDEAVYRPFKLTLLILANYSSFCDEFGDAICKMDGFVDSLRNSLKYYMEKMENGTAHWSEKLPQIVIIGIIRTCANIDSSRSILRRAGLVEILFKYANCSEDEGQRLGTLLALAGVMTEEESKQLKEDHRGLEGLLICLDDSIRDVKLRSKGWSLEILARGVKNLARNDTIKMLLVDLGILAILRGMSQLSGDDEQHAALTILLTLSFNDANKLKIIAEPGLVERIRQLLLDSSHKNTRREAKCILWLLRDDLKQHKEYENIAKESCDMQQEISQNVGGSGSHVMISYNRTHQSEVFIIRNRLQQRGFKTWMYVDDIGAFSLDSMLEAVRNAEAIVICLSRPYKDSTYLRLKLEYASKSGKKLIPLIVECGYAADGWLGRVIANIPCYNIFEESFDLQICEVLGINGEATGTSHEASD